MFRFFYYLDSYNKQLFPREKSDRFVVLNTRLMD